MAYQLVVKNGTLEGERLTLGDDDVLLGRTRSGLNIPDPKVQLRHARVEMRGGEPWLIELGSKHGTMVNGAPVDPDRPVKLQVGNEITIGDTVIELAETGVGLMRILVWMLVPAWVLVAIAAAVLLYGAREKPLVLDFPQRVRTPAPVTQLAVPEMFARSYGLALSDLGLADVTDNDVDGTDEIWLKQGDYELIITFGPSGVWRTVGKVPPGCVSRPGPSPELECGETTYQLVDGTYQPVLQRGVVAWIGGQATGSAGKAGKAKVKVGRVELASRLNGPNARLVAHLDFLDRSRVAGFLSDRGLLGAVHYVLCEDDALGVPAQARMGDGSIVELSQPCGSDLIFGGDRGAAFAGARIKAVAFTATGADRLPKDLSFALTGAADDLMATPQQRAELAHWRKPPQVAHSVALDARATEQAWLAARENHRLPVKALKVKSPVQPAAGGALLNPGTAEFKAGQCTYRVETERFHCSLAHSCMPSATFLSVSELGCGDPKHIADVGYTPGVQRLVTEHAVVQIDIDATNPAPGTVSIKRARLGIRPQ